jgi:hypothetical protein
MMDPNPNKTQGFNFLPDNPDFAHNIEIGTELEQNSVLYSPNHSTRKTQILSLEIISVRI